MRRHRGLMLYLGVLAASCAGFIAAALALGETANAVAAVYMFTPALAAALARLGDPDGFRDAGLRLGRWRDLGAAWLTGIGLTVLSFALFWITGAISWDFTGNGFLELVERYAPGQGQQMVAQLPPGRTLPEMLFLFTLGGLTIFNLPGLLLGFGEEFGWRGFLFPRLWRIRPWVAIVPGGLLWLAWHAPLGLLMPATGSGPGPVQIAALTVGSIATGVVFARTYAVSGSIWAPSLLHITFNNASRAVSYWVRIENQPLADAMLALTMTAWAIVLWRTGRLRVLDRFDAATVGSGSSSTPGDVGGSTDSRRLR